MKNLEEKKLLLQMMRAFGQEDKELAESIRKEEELAAALFKKSSEPKPEPQITKPEPVIVEQPVQPPAPPAFEPPKLDTVKAVVNVLATANTPTPTNNVYKDKELEGIRRTVAEMMQKISTMSWGGGGTGVVRFYDLDDHQYPTDVKALEFNTNGQDSYAALLPGTVAWNPAEDCLNIYQTDNSTLQVGLEQYIRVRNLTGNTMNSGTLVQFAGVNGSYDPIAAPLLANSTFNPIYTIGVLTGDIANGDVGRATTFGKVRDLNTTGSVHSETWNIGDLLWASPSRPGILTNVKPTAPNAAISIAAVTRVDATEGEILVRPTIEPRKYYGSFSDIQNQTAPASNTATPMKFDTVEFASGFRIINYQAGTNNAIQALNTGLYNFQFSSQFTSSNSSRSRIWIWIRKNGQDVKDTATVVAIESNGGVIAPAWNFIVSMQANDVFQLVWATDAFDKVSMLYQANTAFCPAIPSVLLSVSQIAE